MKETGSGDADTGTGTGIESQKTICEIGTEEAQSFSDFKRLVLGINAPETAIVFVGEDIFRADFERHGWFCLKLITLLAKCLGHSESYSWREKLSKEHCDLSREFQNNISSLTALILKELANTVDGIEENEIPSSIRIELGAFKGSLNFVKN